jgi:hypothetical protein
VYIKNKSSVSDIAPFLYESGAPKSLADDVHTVPYRYFAGWALGEIIDNPPVKKPLGAFSEQDTEIWQTWWEAHQHEYP